MAKYSKKGCGLYHWICK